MTGRVLSGAPYNNVTPSSKELLRRAKAVEQLAVL